MAASIDGLRERWERMNSREQRLVVALSLTLVVCLILAMVAKIKSGMAEIEEKNADSRSALLSLAAYRNAKAQVADSAGVSVEIPETAVALDTYLEGIISELGLTSPTYPALKEEPAGEYVELSFRVSLKDLDLVQTTQLLEKIETGSKLVVIKELNIDRNFRDKEKLNLDVTVATYQKKKKKEKEKGAKKTEDAEEEDS
jgi:Tfp pilus assembly protein PilO